LDYRVEAIIGVLRKNLNNDISIKKISEITQLNPCYLSTLFKKESGVSFSSYLRSLRMRYAKIYLRRSLMEIKTIAYNIGYKDISHFYGVFKKMTGLTPSEYRSKYKKGLIKRTVEKNLFISQ